MIPVETCRGCGRLLFHHMVGNITVRLETEALDAQTAAGALMAGRGLWRVTATSVNPARPPELAALAERGNVEGPHIAQEHSCVPVSGPWSRGPAPGSNPPPKAPQGPAGAVADLSTPYLVPQTAQSGAQPAAKPRFKRRADDAQVNLIITMLGATVLDETVTLDAR